MGLLTNLKDSISRAASTLFSEEVRSVSESTARRTPARRRWRTALHETGPATPSARRVTFPTRLVARAERRTSKSSGTARKSLSTSSTPRGLRRRSITKSSSNTTWRKTTPFAGPARRPRASPRPCTGSARTSTASSTCSTARRTRYRRSTRCSSVSSRARTCPCSSSRTKSTSKSLRFSASERLPPARDESAVSARGRQHGRSLRQNRGVLRVI